MGGAIAKTAERAYGDLDPARQAVARRIFLQLTELGEGAEDTRRRVGLDDLLPGDGAARREAEAVLHALARARLVSADDAAAQVSHEALIREWPALQEWLRDNREALRLERRLAAAAAEWEEGRRDPSYLYGGAQLAAACQWAEANPTSVSSTVHAFLDAATAEEERETAEREQARQEQLAQAEQLAKEAEARARAEARAARTSRRWLAIAVGLLGLAVVAAGVAFFQWRNVVETNTELEKAREAAEVAYEDASARLLLNQGQSVFESDPLVAGRLLLEALPIVKSSDVRTEIANALIDNLSSGRVVSLPPGSVSGFTNVLTGTAVFHSLSGKDLLVFDATGLPSTMLDGSVAWVQPIPDSPFFAVSYKDKPGELRRADDGEQVHALDGIVSYVTPIPGSPFFVVGYEERPGELRQTSDGEQFHELEGIVSHVVPIPDSTFFVVGYEDKPGELRRTSDGERLEGLDGIVNHVTPIPGSAFFVIGYEGEQGELRRTDDGEPFIPLDGIVSHVTAIPGSTFFAVGYEGAAGELRRTDDGEPFIPLNGVVSNLMAVPGSTFFVVGYEGEQGELRRTDDGEQFIPLDGIVNSVSPVPNGPFFVVGYEGESSELRWTNDIEQINPLDGIVNNVIRIPDSPFFVIGYEGRPSELHRMNETAQAAVPNELHRTGDVAQVVTLNRVANRINPVPDSPFIGDWGGGGKEQPSNSPPGSSSSQPSSQSPMPPSEVVKDKSGLRVAQGVEVLGEERYFLFRYQDGTGEIVSGEHTLVDLGSGVEQSLYFPETNRVAVRYADGRVVYIDLNLIEALGGADAEETLAAMSPEELVAFTCDLLFTGNLEWDEAKLDEYLAFLPEGRERACGG